MQILLLCVNNAIYVQSKQGICANSSRDFFLIGLIALKKYETVQTKYKNFDNQRILVRNCPKKFIAKTCEVKFIRQIKKIHWKNLRGEIHSTNKSNMKAPKKALPLCPI